MIVFLLFDGFKIHKMWTCRNDNYYLRSTWDVPDVTAYFTCSTSGAHSWVKQAVSPPFSGNNSSSGKLWLVRGHGAKALVSPVYDAWLREAFRPLLRESDLLLRPPPCLLSCRSAVVLRNKCWQHSLLCVLIAGWYLQCLIFYFKLLLIKDSTDTGDWFKFIVI